LDEREFAARPLEIYLIVKTHVGHQNKYAAVRGLPAVAVHVIYRTLH
jgi:hypothetical protein